MMRSGSSRCGSSWRIPAMLCLAMRGGGGSWRRVKLTFIKALMMMTIIRGMDLWWNYGIASPSLTTLRVQRTPVGTVVGAHTDTRALRSCVNKVGFMGFWLFEGEIWHETVISQGRNLIFL